MKSILKKDFFHEKFGDRRYDPYHWMREKDSPQILEYLKAENEHAEKTLKPIQSLSEKIFQEMKARIPVRHDTHPYLYKDYMYWGTIMREKEYPVYKRKSIRTQKEEILLDLNQMAEGKEFYDVQSLKISPDQNLMAYAVDERGQENFNIYFKNLKTGKILEQFIPKVTENFVWANDNQTLFYVKREKESLRSYQIFRENIYSRKKELIFEEKDSTYHVGLRKSSSKEYILMSSISGAGYPHATESYFIPANKPNESPTLFLKREAGHAYHIDHGGDYFYIMTNKDGADHYKIMRTPVQNLSLSAWQEILPYREEVVIEDFRLFKDFIGLEVREQAYPELYTLSLHDFSLEKINFPSRIYEPQFGINMHFDTKKVLVEMSSFIQPFSTYEYDYDTKQLTLKKQNPVGGGFSSQNYTAKKEWAVARDGTKIPLSIVHKKDLQISANTPVFLEGYGAYGSNGDVSFDRNLFSLIDRGFVYVNAHIRGGGEKGKKWYDQGKILNKKNTFYDFIDVAEHLIKKAYTSSSKLYIYGRSAGGLLIGSVLNERPDLFKAAVTEVPFVDALTTMLDETIPLTTGEYVEWGNPNEKVYYDYIKSYSPYDNVKKASYPHLFVEVGYNDTRVAYWEPAKWVARLREYKTDNNQLVFITEMGLGHLGPTGRLTALKTLSRQYAFILALEQSK